MSLTRNSLNSKNLEEFDHSLRIQVLDSHKVILTGVVRREFMKEVTTLGFQGVVALGNDSPLFFSVRKPVFFP